MKKILFLIFLFSTTIYSQILENLYGGKMKSGTSKSELLLNPIGKNVSVKYDTFFEDYSVIYTNFEGKSCSMKFTKSKTAGGVMARVRGIYEYKGSYYNFSTEFDKEIKEYAIIFTQRYEDTPKRFLIYDLKQK
ncbi:MAG: hypothetical protein ABJL44_11745 [Algibacter sp.]